MSDLWTRLTKVDNKVFSVDESAATQAFMDGMSSELKEKKIGDTEALAELGDYRKDFNAKFGGQVARDMANYVKEHGEVNEVSAGFTTPDRVRMRVDFARPTKEADADEWGQSFSHVQSLGYDESLTTTLRSEIGNLFTSTDDEE